MDSSYSVIDPVETKLGVVKRPAGQVMRSGELVRCNKDSTTKRQYLSGNNKDILVKSDSFTKPVVHGECDFYSNSNVHSSTVNTHHNSDEGVIIGNRVIESKDVLVKRDIEISMCIDKN